MKRFVSIITLLVMVISIFSLNASAANNVSANMSGSLSGTSATFVISMSADGLQSYELTLSASGGYIDGVTGSGNIYKSGSSYKVTLSSPSNSANLVVRCTKTSDSITLSASSITVMSADSGSISLNVGLSQTLKSDAVTQDVIETTTELKEVAYLSMLSVSSDYDMSPAFDPNTYEYSISVPNNVNEIDVVATVDKATYVGSSVSVEGADNLKLSNNEIYITVTSQDGEKTVYTIHVNQGEKETTTIVVAPTGSNNTGDEESGSNMTWIAIVAAAAVLVIGGIIAIISTKRQKARAEKFLGTQDDDFDDDESSDSDEVNLFK